MGLKIHTNTGQPELGHQIAHFLPGGDVGQVQLIHPGIAQIQQRQPDSIILLNSRQQHEQAAEDDPYAAYQIPDDLMW